MKSIIVPCVALALLTGCRTTTRTDLSAPCCWQELESPSVAVATPDVLLPIVAADSPEERWAADFLASVLEETCGRRPTVTVERKNGRSRAERGLFVGGVSANDGWTCPLTNESAEAFRVVADGGSVRFLGRADYAVFDWCERELGLRYYCMGGRCAERRTNVVVRAVDYSDRPVFECRQAGSIADPWVRVSKAGSVHRGGVNVHAPSRWHVDESLKAELPDIFETGDTPMLCYGNPKTLEYYKRRIDRQIAGLQDSGGIVDTNRKVVTVCQWDAPVACTCPHCRPLYEGKSASAIVWGRFLKNLSAWLAEAHPDYAISFLPYLNTCELPRSWIVRHARRGRRGARIGSRRSVVSPLVPAIAEAEPCTMPGLALLKNETCRRREEQLLRDWRTATGRKVLNWHYGCWPREWTSAPYVFGRTVQRHYAAMRDVSCGSFVCGGSEDPSLTLSMYVWRRCLWNPDVDVEAIYDEFARRMFGCAARPMRVYIALQEEGWNRQWESDFCTAHNVFELSYPPDVVERMRALLAEAVGLARASSDEVSRRRLLWYASGMVSFLAESKAVAARQGRKVVLVDRPYEMVDARSTSHPQPWAKTTVKTSCVGDDLVLRVRCFEPAVARMDFFRMVKDFVWGNDCVFFSFEQDDGNVRNVRVFLTGETEGDVGEGFEARVSHDREGWTVDARLRLSEGQRMKGKVLGNVCRWRVGDQRHPPDKRTKGSRYEKSRLDTCFTVLDDDPAAFVEFLLR